jgi:predicted O-methyltransferase YrrM
MNGTINHGAEYTTPFGSDEPVSYYSRTSGIGVALAELGRKGPLRVGTIGLGAGTIAAYARPGDVYRFYDINPAVPDIARRYFHYLDLCKTSCDIVLGDARLSLEREDPQQFDLLAVDAFTSDSIPVHLLTREAFALYWRHLKPGGILAVHTSNSYVALAPIVALAAQEDGKTPRLFVDRKRGDAVETTEWILVAANASLFNQPILRDGQQIPIPGNLRAWTDDYSNLWQSMR